MTKWEYHVYATSRPDDPRNILGNLDAQGDAGWELVAVVHCTHPHMVYYYFKREKP
jgi:hypothetical protein